MDKHTIAKVQSFGFDVYMRNPLDTYLHFTDGTRIGYLQDSRIDGISYSTVHKPNRSTGTGFRVGTRQDFDKAELEKCFAYIPAWVSDRASVKKYRDMAEFIESNDWNRAYRKVEPCD